MNVHHLNLNTLCPLGGPLVRDGGWLDGPARYVTHALLVETDDGLVLVDAGFSIEDLRDPGRFPRLYNLVIDPIFDVEDAALVQIQKLGFRREDVRHILPTHLDLDHAGGVADFPDSAVHVFEPEYEAGMTPRAGRNDPGTSSSTGDATRDGRPTRWTVTGGSASRPCGR